METDGRALVNKNIQEFIKKQMELFDKYSAETFDDTLRAEFHQSLEDVAVVAYKEGEGDALAKTLSDYEVDSVKAG